MKKIIYITTLSIFIAFTFYLCSEKQNPVNPYNPKYDPKEWMPANLELKQKNIPTVELSWEQVEENIDGFIVDRKIGQQDIQVGYDTLTQQETTYIDTNAAPG